MLDFNTAEKQTSDLIPSNTLAKVIMIIKPGNCFSDVWLTESDKTGARYISGEFTVMIGKYAKRKFWQIMVVEGGKTDDKGNSIAGNISRSLLRAIVESARNIHPDDESDEAVNKRMVESYEKFNGMEFACKIGIEKDATGNYKDKNKILAVITPDKPEYNAIMTGQEVAPPSTPTTGQAMWGQSNKADAPANNFTPPPAAPQAPQQAFTPQVSWAK